MVVELDISTLGIPEVSRTFDSMAARVNDMQPLFEALNLDFSVIEEKQFSSEGRLGSGGWPALKPETVARKAKEGKDLRILHATHRLLDSLINPEGSEHVFHTTVDTMDVGTRVPYAEVHQHPGPTSSLPKRPPVEFRETDHRVWTHATGQWVLTGKLDIRGSVRL